MGRSPCDGDGRCRRACHRRSGLGCYERGPCLCCRRWQSGEDSIHARCEPGRLGPEMLVTGSAEFGQGYGHDSHTDHPRRAPIRVLHLTSLEKTNYFLNNLVDYCDRRGGRIHRSYADRRRGVRYGTEKTWSICVLSGLCPATQSCPRFSSPNRDYSQAWRGHSPHASFRSYADRGDCGQVAGKGGSTNPASFRRALQNREPPQTMDISPAGALLQFDGRPSSLLLPRKCNAFSCSARRSTHRRFRSYPTDRIFVGSSR